MANWTPMTLTIDKPLPDQLAARIAATLAEDHPLLPSDCQNVEDIAQLLRNGEAVEWENADAPEFSPVAIRTLADHQVAFSFEVRECLMGPGEDTRYDPKTGQFTTVEFKGDLEDADL
jgi:hypothetical protein